jgi:hypothetical protein
MYRMKKFSWRSIGNYPVPVARRELCVSFDRRAMPTGEMVHISALERLGKQVPVDGSTQAYEPKNLRAVIPQIRATYSGRKTCNGSADIAVVDWSGEVLEPAEQAARDKVLGALKMVAA